MKTTKFLIAALAVMVAGAANASYTYGSADGGTISVYEPWQSNTYSRRDSSRFSDKFYIGARLDLNLAAFENKYSLAGGTEVPASDSYGTAMHLGFDLSAGWQFARKWRTEINYAYTGVFSDKDTEYTFDMSAQHLTLNGIYTIREWSTTSLYAGLGAGVGLLRTSFSGTLFAPGAESDKTTIGLVGQFMLGVEEKLMDNLYLGINYKLSYLTGRKQGVEMFDGDTFESDISGILTNTFGLGMRYEF